MRPVTFAPEQIVGLFRKQKVLTKQQALHACGCKTMTFWKALHLHGYLTSYNFNAKYYTLFDIPTFDERGLWSYKNVRFSRWASLSQTLVELVERSPTGYVAKELSSILAVEVAPELSRLYRLGRIQREKLGPAFVYVAWRESRRARQLAARQAELQRTLEEADLPSPEIIIAVLVDLVQHPDTPPRLLLKRLRRRKVPITQEQVRAIFTRYDLARKRGR